MILPMTNPSPSTTRAVPSAAPEIVERTPTTSEAVDKSADRSADLIRDVCVCGRATWAYYACGCE